MNIFKRLFGKAATDPDLDTTPIRFRVSLDVALVPLKGKKGRAPRTIEIQGIEIPTTLIDAPEPVTIDAPTPRITGKARRALKRERRALTHDPRPEPEPEVIRIPDPIGPIMEITNPIVFARDLAILKSVVPTRTPKPILKGIVLEVSRDASVKAHATDLEYSIVLELAGVHGTHPGKVCVDLDSLIKATKVPKGTRVVMEGTPEGLAVITDHSTTILPIETDTSLFPEAPSYPKQWEVGLDMATLQRMLTRTLHATDPGNTRFALGAVCLELVKEGKAPIRFNAVATDGKHLECESIALPDSRMDSKAPQTALVPIKTVKLLERFKERANVALTIKDGNIYFSVPDRVVIFSRCIEGRFPRYREVYPSDHDARLEITSDKMRQQLEKAFAGASKFIGNDGSRGVEFLIHDGTITIKAQHSGDSAKSTRTVKVPDYCDHSVKSCVDPDYMAQAMASHDAPLTIEFGCKNPVMIRSSTHDSIIMPLSGDPATWNPGNPECKDCVVIGGMNDSCVKEDDERKHA